VTAAAIRRQAMVCYARGRSWNPEEISLAVR
jgi:hypothetical protein